MSSCIVQSSNILEHGKNLVHFAERDLTSRLAEVGMGPRSVVLKSKHLESPQRCKTRLPSNSPEKLLSEIQKDIECEKTDIQCVL